VKNLVRKIMISKSNWNLYCTRFLVRARQLTEPVAFTDPLGHEHVGRPGDYLVETSNGIRRIATRAFFEDTYVPMAPAQPNWQDQNLHEDRHERCAPDIGNAPGLRPRQGQGEDRLRAHGSICQA
jgi:hypothetical protein